MLAAIAGALFAIGLLVAFRGLFPKNTSVADRLAQFDESGLVSGRSASDSLIEEYSVMLLETIKGDSLDEYRSDIAVSGQTLKAMAAEKVKAAGAGSVLTVALTVIFGWVSTPAAALLAAFIGGAVSYNLPDIELKSKAAARRAEFSRALTAFITLLSSSIAGGGGISTALKDAAAMGDGWVFTHIRDTLDEAQLDGTSAWVALEHLGRDLGVVPLIELAGSLTLAGTSGSRITETLVARAESSRGKELAEVRSDAEAKSAKLGMPVGLIMLAWAVFIGYPAILNLVGSAT